MIPYYDDSIKRYIILDGVLNYWDGCKFVPTEVSYDATLGQSVVTTSLVAGTFDCTSYPIKMASLAFNINYNLQMTPFLRQGYFYYSSLVGWYNTTGTLIVTNDALHYFKISPPTVGNYNYVTDGFVILATAVISPFAMYYALPTEAYAIWNPVVSFSVSVKPPIMISSNIAALIPSASSTGMYVIDLASLTPTAQSVGLMSRASWYITAPQSFNGDAINNRDIFALAWKPGAGSNLQVIQGNTYTTITWSNVSIPTVVLSASVYATFTKQYVIISDVNAGFYVTKYRDTFTSNSTLTLDTSSFKSISLDVALAAITETTIVSNDNYFAYVGSTGVNVSIDGISWLTIPNTQEANANSIIATKEGFYVETTLKGKALFIDSKCRVNIVASNSDAFPSKLNTTVSNNTIISRGSNVTTTTLAVTSTSPVSRTADVTNDWGGNWLLAGNVMTFLGYNFVNNLFATTQAAVLLTLPPCPYNGQVFTYTTRAAVTAFTVNAQPSPINTLVGGATTWVGGTLAANTSKSFKYNLVANEWFVL